MPASRFIRRAFAAFAMAAVPLAAHAQSQSTCQAYLSTDPSPAGIPAVSGPGVTQRANFLAAGGKLVAIGTRYYAVYIPASFYTSPLPVVVMDLHGTGGYAEAEWTDWNASMAANGVAFIALSWGGGTPAAATDTEIYSQMKQILADVGVACPIASARKYLMGFSVGSAYSFAVMIRDVADAKVFRGQLALSGAAIGPLTTGISVMHPTVESNRSNATAVRGIKSWMYCGAVDFDHVWSMCDEMPYGLAFVNEHGGTGTLYQDPTGTHGSLHSTPAGYNQMYAFLVAKDDQSITFGAAPSVSVGGTGTASATASSGQAVNITSQTTSVCTVVPDTVHTDAVNITSQTTSVCTVSGTTVTGVSAGTCTLAANQAGNAAYNAAPQVTQSFTVSAAGTSRLVNISTRMQVLTGNDVLIGGFIIQGLQPKTVVVRARGPSLVPFGITNALANPQLQLFSGATPIATNDDWGSAANAAAITSSGYAPSNAQEAAIHTTLAPGAYTAIVTGVSSTTGVGIIEVFEVDRPDVPLANISTRGQVRTGNDVMIGGFVIQGTQPQTVVVRARGPSLAAAGISNFLANPALQLFSGSTVIASNDDWGTAANAAALTSAGYAPSDTREAAILITLSPGAYTAVVTGVGGATGVAIVEVFAQ